MCRANALTLLSLTHSQVLAPGPMKRGKAAQAALVAVEAQSRAPLTAGGSGGTAREREFVKCVSDAEMTLMAVGGVKLSVPVATAMGVGVAASAPTPVR